MIPDFYLKNQAKRIPFVTKYLKCLNILKATTAYRACRKTENGEYLGRKVVSGQEQWKLSKMKQEKFV